MPSLRELVSHRHVVELLDALAHGPMTLAEIRSNVPTGRRGLAAALRLVAARGLVARSDNGSWDTDAPMSVVYRPTEVGRRVINALSRFSVWTAMLESADAQEDRAWNR